MKLTMSAIFCRLTLGAFLVCASAVHARDAKTLTASKDYQTTNRADFALEFSANRYGSKSFVVLPDHDTNSIIQVMEHSITQLTVTTSPDAYAQITIILEPANKTYKARTATFMTSAANAEILDSAFKDKKLSIACEFDLIDREKVTSLVFNQHTSYTLISR